MLLQIENKWCFWAKDLRLQAVVKSHQEGPVLDFHPILLNHLCKNSSNKKKEKPAPKQPPTISNHFFLLPVICKELPPAAPLPPEAPPQRRLAGDQDIVADAGTGPGGTHGVAGNSGKKGSNPWVFLGKDTWSFWANLFPFWKCCWKFSWFFPEMEVELIMKTSNRRLGMSV